MEESLCGLFDPTDGNPPKKNEGQKGRRRNRRAGKSESVPEESSFLCSPDTSDLVAKDEGYIETHIEIDTIPDPEKRPKRRNLTRKTRRRKYKVSKESTPEEEIEDVSWNNQLPTPMPKMNEIGKNVNDLTNEYKKVKRKNSTDEDHGYNDYSNAVEKLERILLDGDYESGDFSWEELNGEFYSKFEDYSGDSDSSSDSESCYGRLPPEPRFGNVEYKLQLVAPCERRLRRLVTQLAWRSASGGGRCVYVVGVRDCGAVRGLRLRRLAASLVTLVRMCGRARARCGAAVRRVAPRRAVAEVRVQQLPETNQTVELRVAVLGANEAGKSTLIGVLTQGELDNGQGSARLNMFRHVHEVRSGCTSSLSHEILGFDAQGNVINYGCSELMTAARIGSRSSKLVSFTDLAGHRKYQRTTLHGLSTYSPHVAMLLISGTAGVSNMTTEHLSLIQGLELPLLIVVTKCDLGNNMRKLMLQLTRILADYHMKPVLITDEIAARNCALPEPKEESDDQNALGTVGVFPVSCVDGSGLNCLHSYLLHAQPAIHDEGGDELCEFQIDEVFRAGESGGAVVCGLVTRGVVYEGQQLMLGPSETGAFVRVRVCSVQPRGARRGAARGGAALRLRGDLLPRPGMTLLQVPIDPDRSNLDKTSPPKNVRRKTEELLQDIAEAENSLAKVLDKMEENTYHREDDYKDEDRQESGDENGNEKAKSGDFSDIALEDPYNPRGCMYFQATVRVLNNSASIYPGLQCTVHVENVRQTAVIVGMLSGWRGLSAGASGSCVFRFCRCAEYVPRGRRLLLTAGAARAIGRVTQSFPYIP